MNLYIDMEGVWYLSRKIILEIDFRKSLDKNGCVRKI